MDVLMSRSAGRTEIAYDVDEGREVVLTLMDLSPSDLDVAVRINLARGSRAVVRIASVCTGKSSKVFDVNVRHEGADSYSRADMAGINQGSGELRFLGTSYIANGARGSDTRQDGRVTNLSPDSKSEVSPVLLINDNDVKASHGAALGAYDPEAIYYMMSRGLTEDESKRLITIGSLMPVVDSFADRSLAEEAKRLLGGIGL